MPVIFLSARAGEEARVAGLEAGADDYLVKPFGARELIARVGAALELARVRRTSEERLALANRDLRDRVTELETLLAVIPVGIGIALDPECRNVQVNPAFATTLGLAPGQNASMTAPEGERPSGFRVLDMDGRELSGDELPLQVAAREGRAINDVELDVVHDDGRIVRLLEYTAPLLDEQGRPRGAVGAFVDVTDRRRAEVRDSFLVALDDALRASDDPAAIMVAACRLLGTRLDADRAAYADVEADGDRFTIPHEHTRGDVASPLVGNWSLSAFGERAAREMRAGGTLVVHDVVGELGAATAFTERRDRVVDRRVDAPRRPARGDDGRARRGAADLAPGRDRTGRDRRATAAGTRSRGPAPRASSKPASAATASSPTPCRSWCGPPTPRASSTTTAPAPAPTAASRSAPGSRWSIPTTCCRRSPPGSARSATGRPTPSSTGCRWRTATTAGT